MRFRCELDSRCHNTALLDGEGGKIKQHTRSLLTLGKLFGTEKAKQPHFPVFCDQRKHFSLIYRWQLNKSLMMSFIFLSVIPRGIPMAVCQINWSGSFLSSHHMMSQTPPFFSSSSSIPPPPNRRQMHSHSTFTKGLSVGLLGRFWISINIGGSLGHGPLMWSVCGEGHLKSYTFIFDGILEQLCFCSRTAANLNNPLH